MATKPTEVVSWATDPGAAIDDPGAGVKAAGFTPDSKSPAHWFNWLMNLVGQWIAYLGGQVWTGGGSMAGGFGVTGGLTTDKVTSTGTATEPAVDAEPASSGATGQRAAHRIGPQKAALGSVTKGDVALLVPDVATPGLAKLVIAATATQQDRYVPNSVTNVNQIGVTGSTAALMHTIPANSLRGGSMIEVLLSGRDTTKGTGSPTSTILLRLKDALGATIDFAVTPTWTLAGGGTAKVALHGWCTVASGPADNVNLQGGGVGFIDASGVGTSALNGSYFDTTQGVGVYVVSTGAASDSVFTVDSLVVRVT